MIAATLHEITGVVLCSSAYSSTATILWHTTGFGLCGGTECQDSHNLCLVLCRSSHALQHDELLKA